MTDTATVMVYEADTPVPEWLIGQQALLPTSVRMDMRFTCRVVVVAADGFYAVLNYDLDRPGAPPISILHGHDVEIGAVDRRVIIAQAQFVLLSDEDRHHPNAQQVWCNRRGPGTVEVEKLDPREPIDPVAARAQLDELFAARRAQAEMDPVVERAFDRDAVVNPPIVGAPVAQSCSLRPGAINADWRPPPQPRESVVERLYRALGRALGLC